jgi:hypothetical protein
LCNAWPRIRELIAAAGDNRAHHECAENATENGCGVEVEGKQQGCAGENDVYVRCVHLIY